MAIFFRPIEIDWAIPLAPIRSRIGVIVEFNFSRGEVPHFPPNEYSMCHISGIQVPYICTSAHDDFGPHWECRPRPNAKSIYGSLVALLEEVGKRLLFATLKRGWPATLTQSQYAQTEIPQQPTAGEFSSDLYQSTWLHPLPQIVAATGYAPCPKS